MDFGTLIRAIQTGLKGYSQHKTIVELFQAANKDIWGDGSTPVAKAAAQKWMNGINTGYIGEFKNIEFSDDGFLTFLKNRTNHTWERIQCEFKKLDNDVVGTIIDCNTESRDIFLGSVLQQFKEIVGVPYNFTEIIPRIDENKIIPNENYNIISSDIKFELPYGFVESVFAYDSVTNLSFEFAACLNKGELDSKFTYLGSKVTEHYILYPIKWTL